MNKSKYSVLMSVYHKEKPSYFRESIKSMLSQTVLPDEIVLVKDGILTDELEAVISEFEDTGIMKVIALKENVGLGNALSIGLQACSNELVARADTDDISMPERCEKQLAQLSMHEEVSVIGTAVAEFIDFPENIVAHKGVLVNDDDIKRLMKYRNPMNHPSVMFKKSDVLKAGNYIDWFLNEDYYLWIRMREQGYDFRNINEPLVEMRITNETYLRRGGWKYFIVQKKLFDYMLRSGTINIFEYIYNNSVRFVARILIPNKVRKILYMKLLRKKGANYDR